MELEILIENIMWLFTVPVLKVALQVGVALAAIFLLIQIIRWSVQGSTPNPFAQDERQPRKSYIIDQRKRDEVLKQSFSADKVPENLDAIIIGSGIGGLSTGKSKYLTSKTFKISLKTLPRSSEKLKTLPISISGHISSRGSIKVA